MVSDRLSEMDWSRVVADVSPFLERSEEIEFLTRNNLLSLLNEQKRTECPRQQPRRPGTRKQDVSEWKASPVSGKIGPTYS